MRGAFVAACENTGRWRAARRRDGDEVIRVDSQPLLSLAHLLVVTISKGRRP